MVTPHQLLTWHPAELAGIADAVAAHRSALTRLTDELDDGKPPASWTFADGDAARVEHNRLAETLAMQVSETFGVAAALDAAEAALRSAQAELLGGLRRASWNDLSVDTLTGDVRLTQAYENSEDLAYAQTIASEIEDQIAGAIQMAQTADDALAAALTVASTTDVNTVGGMDVQREIMEFQELSEARQVAYLLEHPEAYERLDDYTSPEVKEQVGEAIGAEMDAVARDETLLNDPENVARYTELLTTFGEDPAVMAPMFEDLGPDGLLATFSSISSSLYIGVMNEDVAALADELRSGLQSATLSDDFDSKSFGEELVRYATPLLSDDLSTAFYEDYPSAGTTGAATLDYLLREGDYGEDFVRGVAWELDEFDRAYPDAAASWMHFNSMGSPLNFLDGAGYADQPDPMGAAMGQLGKHPELGLEFFSNTDNGAERTEYYFSERDWSRDGFEGISEAAFGIGTDPENLSGAPEETARFVSEYFDRLPDNPEFNAENAARAAESVADLLKFYTPAMEVAIDAGSEDYAVGADLGGIGVESYLPDIDPYPLLDKHDLDGLLKVALSTEDGVARLAEGVAGFQRAQFDEYAALHPDGAQADPGGLQSIITSSTKLEGYLQYMSGEIAIEGTESRAQRVETFTNLVSEAVGLIPIPGAEQAGDLLGDVGKNAWEYAWNKIPEITSDTVNDAYSTNVDAVTESQEKAAEQGSNRMIVNTYRALVQAGLVDVAPEVENAWAPNGVVPGIADIPPERLGGAAGDMGNAMNHIVNEEFLRGVYSDQFDKYYKK